MKTDMNVAQVALLSSGIKFLLLFGIGFIARQEIAAYLVQTDNSVAESTNVPFVSENHFL